MPACEGGGNMIQDVTFEKTTFHGPPQRFEAGTGNIADAVGLGAAIDYLDRVGHEQRRPVTNTSCSNTPPAEPCASQAYASSGTAKEKAGKISFVLQGFRTEEVGAHLNRNGIAVRSGHHCAQPILRRFGYESTVRASFALYNTHEDIGSPDPSNSRSSGRSHNNCLAISSAFRASLGVNTANDIREGPPLRLDGSFVYKVTGSCGECLRPDRLLLPTPAEVCVWPHIPHLVIIFNY